MEAALYHPDFGYYTAYVQDLGDRGDFSTSPTLHRILGEAIARWARETRKGVQLGRLDLVEIGAGNGALARAILKATPWWIKRNLRYHIVEKSPKLQKRQKNSLGNRCTWYSCMENALDACNGEALIVSNELVDAFPCRRFEWIDGQWIELALTMEADNLQETSIIMKNAPDSSALQIQNPVEGQRIEVHQSYHRWLKSWKSSWVKGAMLTIDYGNVIGELFYRRPHGTLRAYLRQQRVEGVRVYHQMGKQDLTADVNFTDLIKWGEQAGWKTIRFESQREFILRIQPAAGKVAQKEAAAAFLLNADGAGGSYKVLEQRPASV